MHDIMIVMADLSRHLHNDVTLVTLLQEEQVCGASGLKAHLTAVHISRQQGNRHHSSKRSLGTCSACSVSQPQSLTTCRACSPISQNNHGTFPYETSTFENWGRGTKKLCCVPNRSVCSLMTEWEQGMCRNMVGQWMDICGLESHPWLICSSSIKVSRASDCQKDCCAQLFTINMTDFDEEQNEMADS